MKCIKQFTLHSLSKVGWLISFSNITCASLRTVTSITRRKESHVHGRGYVQDMQKNEMLSTDLVIKTAILISLCILSCCIIVQ